MGLAGAIMAHLQFVPWDVRFDEKIQCFNCMGTSWLFRPCGPEEPAPYYRIDVKEVPSEQEPGMVELEVTVVEEVGLVEDHNIIQPLTKNSKVVGGKQ